MSILIISDVHEDYDLLVGMLRDDRIKACICCGDLTDGFPDEPSRVKLPKPVFSVYGNNEKWDYLKNGSYARNLTWMIAGTIYKIAWLRVAGMGGVKSKSPDKPGHFSVGEVEASLAIPRESVDIFVTHHPPKLYADLCASERKHCGSSKVFRIMETLRPALFISGHIHWQQVDFYGVNGEVSTYVVTLGRMKYGDYGILDKRSLTLYKKGTKCANIYWRNTSVQRQKRS